MRTDILERKAEIEQWIAEGKSKAYMAQQLHCNPKTINPINKRIEEITNTIKGIGISIKLLTKIASPVLPVETTLLGI